VVTAIVLAAGLSARMGEENKLLLSLTSKTVIETVVQNLVAAGLQEIIVITGYENQKVKRSIEKLPVKIIYNADYAKGMTTSIQLGVSIANGTGYMICLSDMPLILPEEYAYLKKFYVKQHSKNDRCICIPRYGDKKGNPVIFSSFYRNTIEQHRAMDGCREIISSNKENITWAQMADDSILRDMDTREEYEKIRNLVENR
jgi:molybdenum cofactor cytidylyltransferase